MPDLPLDQRFVMQLNRDQVATIEAYGFANRIFGRSEAARRILEAGIKALGLDSPQAEQLDARAQDDERPAPTIPSPDDCGKPPLGEMVLPWLRAQGRREYELGDVLEGVFGKDGATVANRDKVVRNVFKAIGWTSSTKRRGGVTTRTFSAPVA